MKNFWISNKAEFLEEVMEKSTTQGEKREKIISVMVQMDNFSNTQNLVQNMFDKTITAHLPVELENIHPTITECHILQRISKNSSMNGTQLAKSLSMTRGGITKVMAKLTQKNLVSREICSNNRKEIYYALTGSGKQIAEIHEVLHEKARERITVALAEYDYAELLIFDNILTKIMNLLDDNYEDCPAKDI